MGRLTHGVLLGVALCGASWAAGCAIRIDWPLHEVEVVVVPLSAGGRVGVERVVARVEDVTLELCAPEATSEGAPSYDRPLAALKRALEPVAWAHVTTSTLDLPQHIVWVSPAARPVGLGTIEPWIGSYCAAVLLVRAGESSSMTLEVDGHTWRTQATGEVRVAFDRPVVFGEDEDLEGVLRLELDEGAVWRIVTDASTHDMEERARHMLGEMGGALQATLDVEAAR
ncbi:MAG: hypothetical protein AAGI01_01710 [Myxococcota bacterium]